MLLHYEFTEKDEKQSFSIDPTKKVMYDALGKTIDISRRREIVGNFLRNSNYEQTEQFLKETIEVFEGLDFSFFNNFHYILIWGVYRTSFHSFLPEWYADKTDLELIQERQKDPLSQSSTNTPEAYLARWRSEKRLHMSTNQFYHDVDETCKEIWYDLTKLEMTTKSLSSKNKSVSNINKTDRRKI